MRTNIVIDDELMAAALKARPNATKRSVVEEGLRLVAQLHRQRRVRSLRGKLRWEGDLETMRRDNSDALSGRLAYWDVFPGVETPG
jgi:Arc/MetJ family transcription regulator